MSLIWSILTLYKAVESGISQATVIVIDPEPIAIEAQYFYIQEQAEPGIDYTYHHIADICAMTLIAGSPLAYLPEKLDLFAPLSRLYPAAKLSGFAPEDLLKRVGGLDGAKVLAARAHAMFDVEQRHRIESAISDFTFSPLRDVVFREILSTARGFDAENPTSVDVLNNAADVIASSMQESKWFEKIHGSEPLVREFSSRDVDFIQAADMLEYQEVRTLGSTFRRVILNGRLQ
jgi:hypothetical protein